MFVGFDSLNTSHSFPHYPNWDLWIREISLIWFKGWSEKLKNLDSQHICRPMSLPPHSNFYSTVQLPIAAKLRL